MPEIRDPFDPIYDEDPRDPFSSIYDPEPLGAGALISDIGAEIADAPTHALGAIGRIWEGIDPEEIWGARNLADEWIAESEQAAHKRATREGQARPYFSGWGPTREDIAGGGASLGASGASMIAGLGAGLATGAAAGPIAGYVAGAAGTAGTAYRQSGNEFLRRAVGMASQAAMEETGREMTPEEKMQVANEFIPFAEKHGLWEAGTETASNVLGFKILATPLKRIFGDRVVTNFLGKSAAILGEELPAETINYIGQKNNEIEAGLSKEEKREWNKLDSYSEGFHEILYPTLLTTGVMGGAIGTGTAIYRAGKQGKETATEEEERMAAQIERSKELEKEKIAQRQVEAAVTQAPTVEAAGEEANTSIEAAWREPQELTGRERIRRRRAIEQVPTEPVEEPVSRETLEVAATPEETEVVAQRNIDRILKKRSAQQAGITPEEIRELLLSRKPAPKTAVSNEAEISLEQERKIMERQRARRIDRLQRIEKAIQQEKTTQIPAPTVEDEATAPTPAQIEAGNYKKKHVRHHGFDISIENTAGSVRRSKPGAKKEWAQEMAHDYGYLRGTTGRDKDRVDVFLGNKVDDETLPIFVVDQVNPDTGKFDEHKVILGAATEQEARDTYLANYEPGWQGLGNVTEMSPEVFKEWARDSEATKRPAAEYETTLTDISPTGERAPDTGARVLEVGGNPFSNLSKRHPGLEQGYSGLDVPSKRAVVSDVVGLLHNDEIFRSVVPSVPVDMMNAFIGKEFSADDILSNKSVFINNLTANEDSPISASIIDYLVSLPALRSTENRPLDVRGTTANRGAAVGARKSGTQSTLKSPVTSGTTETTRLTGRSGPITGESLAADFAVQTKPPEGEKHAEKVYQDEGRIQRRRTQRKSRKREGRKDIQQSKETRTKARDAESARKEKARKAEIEEPPFGGVQAPKEDIAQEITRTGFNLGGNEWNTRVWIADIVESLPNRSVAEIHETLLRLSDEGKAVLYPLDDPREKFKRDRDAEMIVGGEPAHLVYFEAPQEGPRTLRERPKSVEKFLVSLPAQQVIDDKTGEQIEVTGEQLNNLYQDYNQRVDALKRVLDCIG